MPSDREARGRDLCEPVSPLTCRVRRPFASRSLSIGSDIGGDGKPNVYGITERARGLFGNPSRKADKGESGGEIESEGVAASRDGFDAPDVRGNLTLSDISEPSNGNL
jgi:hypothetical protein